MYMKKVGSLVKTFLRKYSVNWVKDFFLNSGKYTYFFEVSLTCNEYLTNIFNVGQVDGCICLYVSLFG